MREILNQTDFEEMILQSKAILTFYQNWSKYSGVGVQHFKESHIFFRNQKEKLEINFWLANVSDRNSPAFFLHDWIKNNSINWNLFVWIGAGNPSVIWLNFGQILNCEFSAYILKSHGIIEKTNKFYNL